jgi:hypothetical protein
MMKFTYLNQPPKRYTFEQPKLKTWVEHWCQGKVLNLFAGKTKLNVDEFRVDLDKHMVADHYGDAYTFVQRCRKRFDTIILDPPYSLRKSMEKYQGHYVSTFTKLKNHLPNIIKDNGRVISLGYSSVGMSKTRGFRKIALCLICHNGAHHDTIAVVEEKDE